MVRLNYLMAVLSASYAVNAYGGHRPCGLKIAPCPNDQECVPNDESCTDLNRCLGYCDWKNEYPDCGGFRVEPKYCDERSECKDDPREPESCGMACDVPGICIPKDASTCDEGHGCPSGLYCYKTVEYDNYGQPCDGSICL